MTRYVVIFLFSLIMCLLSCTDNVQIPPPTQLALPIETRILSPTPILPTSTLIPSATLTNLSEPTFTPTSTTVPTFTPTQAIEPSPFDLSINLLPISYTVPFGYKDEIAFYVQDNRLNVSNISDPQSLRNLWQSDLLGANVQGLGMINNHAYLVSDNNLLVWNFDNIFNPIIIATVPMKSGQPYLDVEEKLLYLIQTSIEGSQITTVDLSVPDLPIELGTASLDWSEVFFPFMISDKLLFLVGNGYIEIVDISEPNYAVQVSQIVVPTNINSEIIMLDNLLFVGTHSGIFIFDLNSIFNPQMVGQYSNLQINHMSVDGRLAYLYSEICGWEPMDDGGISGGCGYLIEIVDCSNLSKPELKGYVHLKLETNQSFVDLISLRGHLIYFETVGTFYIMDKSIFE